MRDLFRITFLLFVGYVDATSQFKYPNVCEKNSIGKEYIDQRLKVQELEFECCPGYEGTVENCKPVCSSGCGINSFCQSPENCGCLEGYEADENGHCFPKKDANLCSKIVKVETEMTDNSGWNELELAFKNLKLKLPTPYPTSFKTEIRHFCCDGYERQTEKDLCQPQCSEKCEENSFCSKPNVCECNIGYHVATSGLCAKDTTEFQANDPHVCSIKRVKYVNLSNFFKLFTTSSNPEKLIKSKLETQFFCCPGYVQKKSGGVCLPKPDGSSSSNKCQCEDGYTKSQYGVCEPICPEGCPTHSRCIEPERCECNEGYTNNTSADKANTCQPICKLDIPENGLCVRPNEWECAPGYIKLLKPESSDYYCAPHCEESCFTFATCVEPNVCKCLPGYKISTMEIDINEPRDLCVRIINESTSFDPFKYSDFSFRSN